MIIIGKFYCFYKKLIVKECKFLKVSWQIIHRIMQLNHDDGMKNNRKGHGFLVLF